MSRTSTTCIACQETPFLNCLATRLGWQVRFSACNGFLQPLELSPLHLLFLFSCGSTWHLSPSSSVFEFQTEWLSRIKLSDLIDRTDRLGDSMKLSELVVSDLRLPLVRQDALSRLRITLLQSPCSTQEKRWRRNRLALTDSIKERGRRKPSSQARGCCAID